MSRTDSPSPRRLRRRAFRRLIGLGLLTVAVGGCSLGVMTGKMLVGDPMVPAPFRQITGVDLTEGERQLLIICSTPEYLHAEYSTLKFDLLDGVSRRLRAHDVNVVNPDQVARWIDDNGGIWDDPNEIARDFETDYIVIIDVQEFQYREDNSPKLLRGHSSGTINAYEVVEIGGERTAQQVFVNEFTSVWPRQMPLSIEQQSEKVFRKQYLDRVSDQLAQMFYDYRPDVGI